MCSASDGGNAETLLGGEIENPTTGLLDPVVPRGSWEERAHLPGGFLPVGHHADLPAHQGLLLTHRTLCCITTDLHDRKYVRKNYKSGTPIRTLTYFHNKSTNVYIVIHSNVRKDRRSRRAVLCGSDRSVLGKKFDVAVDVALLVEAVTSKYADDPLARENAHGDDTRDAYPSVAEEGSHALS